MQIGFLPRIIRFLFNHSDQADALIEAFRTTGFTLPLGRLLAHYPSCLQLSQGRAEWASRAESRFEVPPLPLPSRGCSRDLPPNRADAASGRRPTMRLPHIADARRLDPTPILRLGHQIRPQRVAHRHSGTRSANVRLIPDGERLGKKGDVVNCNCFCGRKNESLHN